MQDELRHARSRDFLYVDYERVCSFLQQVKGEGALSKSEEGFNTSDSESHTLKGKLPPLVDASKNAVSYASQSKVVGHETYWHNVLEFLEKCSAVNGMKEHASNRYHLLEGTLSLIDLDLIQNGIQSSVGTDGFSNGLEAIQLLFKGVIGNFSVGNSRYWFTLNRGGLKQEPSTLALKYGVSLGGGWSCICIVDTLATAADERSADETIVLGNVSINEQLVHLYEKYKDMLGEPAGFIGITPILIFREVDFVENSSDAMKNQLSSE